MLYHREFRSKQEINNVVHPHNITHNIKTEVLFFTFK